MAVLGVGRGEPRSRPSPLGPCQISTKRLNQGVFSGTSGPSGRQLGIEAGFWRAGAIGRGKVRDFLQGNRRRKLIDWLAIDSRIDSGLYRAWIGLSELCRSYSTFFRRFVAPVVVA